ncbi:MAG: hypothetical protein ACRDQA_18310 [Nocardioidaceae bacterium]
MSADIPAEVESGHCVCGRHPHQGYWSGLAVATRLADEAESEARFEYLGGNPQGAASWREAAYRARTEASRAAVAGGPDPEPDVKALLQREVES